MIHFYKYQGTGNDFIIIPDRRLSLTSEQIASWCDRKFGVGADGLILIGPTSGDTDFDMMYYNADGSESFCGNGSRCAIHFAKNQGWWDKECTFNSNDGIHNGKIENGLIALEMHVPHPPEKRSANEWIANTGSPHYMINVGDIMSVDPLKQGREIRYNDEFSDQGINVNFIAPKENGISIRTYERGVEDETLSCGTGVTAAALTYFLQNPHTQGSYLIPVETQGGQLSVRFEFDGTTFSKVYLIGPAVKVFEGQL